MADAVGARTDRPVPLARPDPPELRAPKEALDRPAALETTEALDPLDPPETPDPPDPLEIPDPLATKARTLLQEAKATLVGLAVVETQVRLERTEIAARLAITAVLATPARLEAPVRPVATETKDRLARPARPAVPARMPSTARARVARRNIKRPIPRSHLANDKKISACSFHLLPSVSYLAHGFSFFSFSLFSRNGFY